MSCEILYSVLNDPCIFNIPGVTKIKFAISKHVNALPALQDYDADQVLNEALTLTGDMTLDTVTYPTAVWHDGDLEIDENGLKVDYNGKPGSGTYSTTMEGFITNVSRAGHLALHRTNKNYLVIAILNKDGNWRVIGDPINPATLAANFDGGKAAEDKVGFTVNASWAASGTPPPFYDGTF